MVPLTDIPFSFNKNLLFGTLNIRRDTDRAKEFEGLLDEVQAIGKPKALYKVSFIDEKGADSVTIDGVRFTSPALRKILIPLSAYFRTSLHAETKLMILR